MLGDQDLLYIQRLRELRHAYPALRCFLDKIENSHDECRRLVEEAYMERFERLPGRCTLLTFNETNVESRSFERPENLDDYLTKFPPCSDSSKQRCRLWILEDLHPTWIDILGGQLGVDPLTFSEQMNTWNFTDSNSIPTRLLPSMVKPQKSFTLRYYEFRQLKDPQVIDVMRNQMTFAINRRRYERWRDVDTESFRNKWRHAFVRRCASFWTNQNSTGSNWDAVMLVDPSFDSFGWRDTNSVQTNGQAKTPSRFTSLPGCTILQDPKTYGNLKDLWNALDWAQRKSVRPTKDTSKPYHDGCTTLAETSLATEADNARAHTLQKRPNRNLSSLLDEMAFYWTELADQALITSAREHSVNTAHYLLKYVATFWTNQLDLIACGLAQSEYFADDHTATVEFGMSGNAWKKELIDMANTTKEMNYMKRQMNHFEQAMTLNMERLGLVIGAEAIDEKVPQAIKDAQKDFITIQARLRPFCERVDGLSGVANELANLHAGFKSIQDGEFSLRLSVFASIIFPATLVSSLFSMGDAFLPGRNLFWVYWVAAVPLVFGFAGALLFGRKPERWLRRQLVAVKAKLESGQGPRRRDQMA
ncbi:MAG: hypothetical protein Q9165_006403 [Trypethelium subeluteriae]